MFRVGGAGYAILPHEEIVPTVDLCSNVLIASGWMMSDTTDGALSVQEMERLVSCWLYIIF